MAGDVDAVDRAPRDVKRENDLAPVLGTRRRKGRHRAWTCEVAVAGLEVSSFDIPAHAHTSTGYLPKTLEGYYDPDVSSASRGPMKMPKPNENSQAAFSQDAPDEPAITLKPTFGQMSALVPRNTFVHIVA